MKYADQTLTQFDRVMARAKIDDLPVEKAQLKIAELADDEVELVAGGAYWRTGCTNPKDWDLA